MTIKGVRRIYLVLATQEPETDTQADQVCEELIRAVPGMAIAATVRSPVSLPLVRETLDGTFDAQMGEALVVNLMQAVVQHLRDVAAALLTQIDARLDELDNKTIN